MPHYVPDPENPGQHIDIIQLLGRDPSKPLPVPIDGLLKRDLWTRQEALLILAGLDPRNVVDGGYPIGTIGAGIVYLDGTTSAQLDAQGLQHPRAQDWLPEFDRLKGYAAGQDMGERKAPAEWLAWAKSKAFTPYWLRSVECEIRAAAIAADLRATEHAQDSERVASGRYALWDAAKAIGSATAAPFEPVLEALIEAANRGELTIYQAGVKFPHKPEGPLGALAGHEAYWSDLNAWLRAHKVQGDFAFPEPQQAALAEQATTIAGPPTLPEQWKAAAGNVSRRHELATGTVKACGGNKTEAARRLGTQRQLIDRALHRGAAHGAAHGAAGGACMYAQLGGKAHKT